jgi:GAF domain-containing protein
MTLTPEALAEQRLAELITLNELGLVVSSTLDRDELIERALQAVTRHLRFDRALIMLVDPARNVLTDGRSVGGSSEMAARIAELELPVDLEDGLLSRIARSAGPLLFRDVD